MAGKKGQKWKKGTVYSIKINTSLSGDLAENFEMVRDQEGLNSSALVRKYVEQGLKDEMREE